MNIEKSTIKLQDIVFSLDNKQVDSSLLFLSNKEVELVGNDSLLAFRNTSLNFNTYFNSFSLAKWKKYTDIENLFLKITFEGRAEVSLYESKLLYGDACLSVIDKTIVNSSQEETVLMPINPSNNAITCSFAISVLSEQFVIKDCCYVTDNIKEDKAVSLALVFTTFNREKYIRSNIENISKVSGCSIHTYVIDNASSLQISSSEDISIIPNMNSGGAGGFTRGMIQVIDECDKYEFTHCILMDDDAFIDSAIITRLVQFLSFLKTEYNDSIVAGAMLRKDLTYMQVESGATWNKGIIKSNGHGLDLRQSINVLINNMEEEADYAAWWFCTIPISYINNENLALPIFVFNDDVDFGIRTTKTIITLNGLCVWHDAFESKKNAMRCYYESRNKLIVNSCNDIAQSRKSIISELKNTINFCVALYQYENAEAVLDGVKDFLNGPEWLCNINPEEFNKTIVSRNVKQTYIDPLKIDYNWYRLCCTIRDCDWLHRFVRIITKNGYYLKADRDIILPLYAGNIEAGYRAKSITYYDEITSMGFVVERDIKRRKELLAKCKKVCRMIKKNYRKVVRDYKEQAKYLRSREQWEKYLKL